MIEREEIEMRTLTLVLGCNEKMTLHEEHQNLCLGVTNLSLSIDDLNAIVLTNKALKESIVVDWIAQMMKILLEVWVDGL